MFRPRIGRFLAAALGLMSLQGSARSAPGRSAVSAAEFYGGKTIDLVIGLPVGSGFDAYGRLIAAHIGQHIPGHPTVAAQNMPGAGGLVTANYIFNTAPKDGTVFGLVATTVLMAPLFGEKQAYFDASKFRWLGSASQSVNFCALGPSSKVKTFDQWLQTGKELTFGASGPAAGTYKDTRAVKNVLGAHLRTITGYSGVATAALAVERGEVDGICGVPLTTLEGQFKPLLENGKMTLILQMGPRRDNSFGPVPSVFDYAKTGEQREILSFLFDQLALGKPFMAPPGIPESRYEALDTAFAETLKDPALLADAMKMKLDIEYLSGDDTRKLLKQFADFPPSTLAKAIRAVSD